MHIDLRRLSYALTIARTRNFSRAAKQLSITQPALSRSIASLEADLDVRLFERGRGGVVVTPAGRALTIEAEQLLLRARLLEQSISQWRDGQAGSVNFGMGPLPASIFLPRLLAHMARSHPRLLTTVAIYGVHELVPALEADRIEFGVCAETSLPHVKHLARKIIARLPLGLFVRSGHPLARKNQPTSDDIASFPVASGTLPTSAADDNWVARLRLPNFFCDDYHVLKEVMLGSDVIWLASPLLLTNELAEERAVELELGLPEEDRIVTFCAVRLANRPPSPTAELLVRLMTEMIGSQQQGSRQQRQLRHGKSKKATRQPRSLSE